MGVFINLVNSYYTRIWLSHTLLQVGPFVGYQEQSSYLRICSRDIYPSSTMKTEPNCWLPGWLTTGKNPVCIQTPLTPISLQWMWALQFWALAISNYGALRCKVHQYYRPHGSIIAAVPYGLELVSGDTMRRKLTVRVKLTSLIMVQHFSMADEGKGAIA